MTSQNNRYIEAIQLMPTVAKVADKYAVVESTDAYGRFVSLAVHLTISAMCLDVSEVDRNAYFKAKLEKLKRELDDWLPPRKEHS